MLCHVALYVFSVGVLWYGNLEFARLWNEKALAAFKEIDLPSAKDEEASDVAVEVYNILVADASIMLMCGIFVELSSLLTALGLNWGKKGFKQFDRLMKTVTLTWPPCKPDEESIYCQLMMILASPRDALDKDEVNAWILSPQALADMDRDHLLFRRYADFDVASTGARAFLKLGRDDDAYELARLAVSPEQNTVKKTTLVSCHSILGQVAAKRGELQIV